MRRMSRKTCFRMVILDNIENEFHELFDTTLEMEAQVEHHVLRCPEIRGVLYGLLMT